MARRPRRRSESGLYHVMLRGINKQIIFESDDDRFQLLSTMKRFVDTNKFVLYGYCLMDNHVHLLIQELEDDISNAIKRICSSYVLWYNKKYERCGHLFQERFKSQPVETDNYFLMILRYIHQNPIKARLCKDLLEYKWTSYREYIQKPIIVDTEFCLSLFSPDMDRAVDLFIEYMTQNNEDSFPAFEDNISLTDTEVLIKLNDMGIRNISELQKLEKNRRNSFIKELKMTKGISIRQISRITGISKGIVERS
ncbi:transposase [Gudongella sp. DL1XJH-153]|uniref:transposase n=1 Tax=Gudongella sp. DL1XJH-153 TaxID=3409804 RepID=UPI003BB6835E